MKYLFILNTRGMRGVLPQQSESECEKRKSKKNKKIEKKRASRELRYPINKVKHNNGLQG